jgi:hypothetical protein
VLWIYFFTQGWGDRAYTVGDTGVMAVAVILGASSIAMIVGSLLSSPPEPERVERFIAQS